MEVVYLACPYVHENPAIMDYRVKQATEKAAELMLQGYNVFSPLTHSDPIADELDDETRFNHDFWLSRDIQLIQRCVDEIHVLCLEGWEESKGVGMELDEARRLGLNVVYHAG